MREVYCDHCGELLTKGRDLCPFCGYRNVGIDWTTEPVEEKQLEISKFKEGYSEVPIFEDWEPEEQRPAEIERKGHIDVTRILTWIVIICGAVTMVGYFASYFIALSKGRSYEEISWGYLGYIVNVLGNDKFSVPVLLWMVSTGVYVFLGAFALWRTAKTGYDFSAPSMAGAYALLALPEWISLADNAISYLSYKPDGLFGVGWLPALAAVLMAIGFLAIIGCASTMYPGRVVNRRNPKKVKRAIIWTYVCGAFAILAALALAYNYWLTLDRLIKTAERLKSEGLWWVRYGVEFFYELTLMLGLITFWFVGAKYRKSLKLRNK